MSDDTTPEAPATATATIEPPADDLPPVEDLSRVRDLPPVTEREVAARRRGLDSAYIEGGEDPDPEATRRQEARYIRLLILMVVLIVGSGLVVSFVGLVLAGPAR